MKTKDKFMFSKDRHHNVTNNVSNTDKSNQYLDLNLNCQILIPVQYPSNPKNDKYCDSKVSNKNDKREKSEAWNKSDDLCLHALTLNDKEEDVKNNWKKNGLSDANNSTLSLHISAYQNSKEIAELDKINVENVESKKNKTNMDNKQFFPSLMIQNLFEFPRQQKENQVTEPEVSGFRASQRLLGSSQSTSTSTVANRNQFVQSNPVPLMQQQFSGVPSGFGSSMTSRTKKKKKAVPAEKKPTASVDIPYWEKLQSQINIIIASVPNNTISLPHLQKDVLETFGYNLHDAAQNYEYSSIQEMLSDMTEAVQIKHTHMGVMVSAAVVDASAHVTEMIKKTKSKKSRRPNCAPILRRPGYSSFRPASSKAPHRSFGHPSTRGGSSAHPSTRGGNSANHSARGGSSAHPSTRGGNSANHSIRGGNSAHPSTRGGSFAHPSTRGGSSAHRPSYNEAPRRVPIYDSHFFENSPIRPLPSSGNAIQPSSLSSTRRFTSSDGTQLQSSIPSQTSSVRPSPSVDLWGNPIRTSSSSGIQSFTSSVGTQPQSYISSPIPLGPPPSKSSSVCPSSFGDTYYVQNSALSGTRRFTSSVSTEPQPSITSSISMAPAPSQNSSIRPTSSDGLDGNSIRPSASNGTRRFTSSVGTEPSSSNSSLISFGPPLSETSAVRFASTGAVRLSPSGNSTQPLPLNGTRRFASSVGIQSQSSTSSSLSFGPRSSQSSTVRLTSFEGFSAVPHHGTSFAKSCTEKPSVSTQQSVVQLWKQRLPHNRKNNGAASSRTQSPPRTSESANQTMESEFSRIVSLAPSVHPAPMPHHDSHHKPSIPPKMLSRSEALLYEKKTLADYIDKVCFKSAIPQN